MRNGMPESETEHAVSADRRIHRLFERQAATSPEALAVVYGEQRLTYRQLNQRANQIARHLRKQGVAQEELIGVALARSPLMIMALLGVWKAGCAYVPLDPGYPAERLGFMWQDAGLRLVLADETFADKHSSVRLLTLDQKSSAWQEAADDLQVPGTDSDLAYVMYTSGSTGQPKGAMITHEGLANYLCWAIDAYGVGPGGSVPVHSSLSFDLTVTSLYVPLLAGAHIELLSEDGPAHQVLVAALRAQKRSLVKITPAHLELLSQELRAEELAGMVDVFVIGGEALTAERLALWRKHAPATRLINEYGPTETVVGCCIHEVAADDPASGAVPIGRPIAHMRLHVLDESLAPVPAGAAGELYIGGPGVARGYLNRPQLSEQRFIPDPFSDVPGARLYKTGDLARHRAQGDGVLEYLGRSDDQVKIRGYRIEPGEIEHALGTHPAVNMCAVLAHESVSGDKELLGFVVAGQNTAPEPASLTQFLRQRLPSYMVPARFIRLDVMPLNRNGKIDRSALRAMAATGELQRSDGRAAPLVPRTATEAMVMKAFQQVFQRIDIGVFDSFFEVGGHSMLAVRLMAALRAASGLNLPLRNLYEQPSVAGLADTIDAMRWSADAPRMRAPSEESVGRTQVTF